MRAIQNLIDNLVRVNFQPDGWRFEDKFLIPAQASERFSIFSNQNLPHLVEVFSPRTVNSIYFDYPNNELSRQSIDGDEFKSKIRFRWYGSSMTPLAGRLEIKLKAGEQGIKLRSPEMEYPQVNSQFWRMVRNFLSSFDCLRPKVLVSYSRRYYQSLIHDSTLTIDQNISVSPIFRDLENLNPLSLTPHLICEVKEPIKSLGQGGYQPLTIPLRKIKFSKYDQACKFLGI